MKFKVTKEILKEAVDELRGKPNKISQACAIAKAVRVVFPNAIFNGVVVNTSGSWYTGPSITAPDNARDYARDFDMKSYEQRLKMEEFEFELDIPETI